MSYYAFQHHRQLLTMGLGRLDLDDWLIPDAALARETAIKQALWRQHGEAVFSALPMSRAAQQEVARLLSVWLPARYPDLYQTGKDGLYCVPMKAETVWRDCQHPLLQASWCVQEDLCILQESDGEYLLTAASLCAPSYWRLQDKIGRSMDAVHAPVPDYADQLASKVNRFLKALTVRQPVWRGNWSVVASDQLYQPGDLAQPVIDDPDLVGQSCYLRMERQTLRRLPETGAILFTIRVTVTPLEALCCTPDVLADLRKAIAGLSDAERRYKSLHRLEPALSDWLGRGAG